jgi:endonuclease/exonuclease/phosphatase family metal-dependent hydrolase
MNHTLYLGVMVVGGAELIILSLALQVVTSFIQSRKEYREGKYLEAFGHLAMMGVRGYQLKEQMDRYKQEIEALMAMLRALHGLPAEGLGAKWQFPSDHLPVGAKVGNARILSWNVLNKSFISWVYNNSQGLKGSMLTELDKPSEKNPKLTRREELVIQYILEMIANHDNVILALQECHPDFARALVQALPVHMGAILSDPSFKEIDLNVTLYDKNSFRFVGQESSIVKDVFPLSDPRRSVMDSMFQEIATGQKFQVVNVHIPGDPEKPGREEFAKYLLSYAKKDAVTIGLGDMNFREHEMQQAFDNMASKLHTAQTFSNIPTYNTNISPYTFEGKSIDHIWVDTKRFQLALEQMAADQVLFGLQATVDLITEVRMDEARLRLNRQQALSLNSSSGYREEKQTSTKEQDLEYNDWRRGDWGGWSDGTPAPDTQSQEEHDAEWEYNQAAWGRS